MAKIDYWAIEQELAEIIRSSLDGYTVEVEPEMMFAAEQTPWVSIYLLRRDAPEGQPIAANKRLRLHLQFSIYVWCWHLEKREALRLRNAALGELELVLLRNPTVNDMVNFIFLEGGELQSGRVEGTLGGFASGGEILLTAEAVAIVT